MRLRSVMEITKELVIVILVLVLELQCAQGLISMEHFSSLFSKNLGHHQTLYAIGIQVKNTPAIGKESPAMEITWRVPSISQRSSFLERCLQLSVACEK